MFESLGQLVVFYLFIKIALSLWRGLYSCFLANALGHNANLPKLGSWAVVTGSTDGIGKAYAEQIAEKGMNIVLISRNIDKLKDVAKNIEDKSKVEVKIIEADFRKRDIYEHIDKELEGLDIGVLVNNVGMSYKMPSHLEELDDEFVKDILWVNNVSMLMMIKLVLKRMKAKKKGLIINISSFLIKYPSPYYEVYGATKAFVHHFSRSLSLTLKYSGIKVQCVYPGYVCSKMSKIRNPSFFVPMPNEFVKGALASAGVESTTAGYFAHKLQVYFIEFVDYYLPSFILNEYYYKTIYYIRQLCLYKIVKTEMKKIMETGDSVDYDSILSKAKSSNC